MPSLFDDRLAPITTEFGFVDADVEDVAHWYRGIHPTWGRQVVRLTTD